MALISKSSVAPLLLTYDNKSMYLHIDSHGCALFHEDNPEPLYRSQEPILLAQGIMTGPRTVHLVILKSNGELCYNLITDSGTPQTSLLAKLDVRTTRYRRLFLFPIGKLVHIFYAYSNNAIPDLWRVEHRFWDGASWRSVHMGEVIHPREPLYHVSIDSQGNIHYLTMTFQGRQSLLFANRFNGAFHIWGSPTEVQKITGEVVDMTALMTTDNVHHLFWAVKTPSGQFELRWAQHADALQLSSNWLPSPAPIKTFNTPWKRIGALEKNGVLWLLAHTGEEVLMLNDGKGWLTLSSHASINRPLQWVQKGEKNFYQTYWLENLAVRRAPAFYQELGFTINKQGPPLPPPIQPISNQIIPPAPPPVPAYYPEQPPVSSVQLPPVVTPVSQSGFLDPGELKEHEISQNQLPDTVDTSNSPPPFEELPAPPTSPEKVHEPPSLKENPEFQSLLTTVAYLEQKNIELQSLIKTVTRLEKENSELQPLITSVDRLEEDNSKLESLVSTVSYLEQENTKLQSFVSTVTNLEQENAKLQSLFSAVSNLEQENLKLQPLFSTIANLKQENSKLQSLVSTVSKLEQENDRLQSVVSTVSNLEQENSRLQSLVAIRNEQENAELQSLNTTIAHLEEENTELRSFITSRLEQENNELQSLNATAAHLEEENSNLSLAVQDLLARFDQILEVISEKDLQTKQEVALLEELIAAQTVTAPLTDLEPFKEAMSNLQQENQSLSDVLRLMLTKQEESDTSLEKLESQLSQLQEEREALKNKGGFWNKWIT